jgi:hypothetical protein
MIGYWIMVVDDLFGLLNSVFSDGRMGRAMRSIEYLVSQMNWKKEEMGMLGKWALLILI